MQPRTVCAEGKAVRWQKGEVCGQVELKKIKIEKKEKNVQVTANLRMWKWFAYAGEKADA